MKTIRFVPHGLSAKVFQRLQDRHLYSVPAFRSPAHGNNLSQLRWYLRGVKGYSAVNVSDAPTMLCRERGVTMVDIDIPWIYKK